MRLCSYQYKFFLKKQLKATKRRKIKKMPTSKNVNILIKELDNKELPKDKSKEIKRIQEISILCEFIISGDY